ncbi:MAG: phosphatase PAP2 family protein [Clostridiales bacterium]|nr:phosphatase PAP2 family protein [Clostridiales bacterium]
MSWIQNIDISILLWIQNNIRQDFWTPIWKTITFLGNGGWFWIAAAVLLLFFKKTRTAGILGLFSMGLGALITNVCLKNLVARPRPYDICADIIPLIDKPADYSFPSGHTCASFACALILWKPLPRKWGIPSLILATLIAFSRMYVGVHYPSDILGGFIVAFFSSAAVYAVYRRISGCTA